MPKSGHTAVNIGQYIICKLDNPILLCVHFISFLQQMWHGLLHSIDPFPLLSAPSKQTLAAGMRPPANVMAVYMFSTPAGKSGIGQ